MPSSHFCTILVDPPNCCIQSILYNVSKCRSTTSVIEKELVIAFGVTNQQNVSDKSPWSIRLDTKMLRDNLGVMRKKHRRNKTPSFLKYWKLFSNLRFFNKRTTFTQKLKGSHIKTKACQEHRLMHSTLSSCQSKNTNLGTFILVKEKTPHLIFSFYWGHLNVGFSLCVSLLLQTFWLPRGSRYTSVHQVIAE